MICCETCPKTKSKLQAATGRPQCGTFASEGPTVPKRRCIRRSPFHFSFSVLLSDGKRLTDLVFVESCLTTHHCIFESTFGVEQYIQEHIRHCLCVDLFCSMMVDCMNNWNLGMLWSLMMFPDDLGQAIENPSCGMEALAAQECCMVGFWHSSLTENRYVCECCDDQVSGIVGDPFRAMVVYWLIFQLCEKEQLDHCLVTWLTEQAVL